jgi:abortive infection bacteriophage resistance protein
LDKLFSQILALQNLCPKKNMWLDFCYDLFVLIETYPRVNIKAYGFPNDWKEKLEGRV